jgi:hypothetical protein
MQAERADKDGRRAYDRISAGSGVLSFMGLVQGVTAIPTAKGIRICLMSISGGLRQMRDLSLRVDDTS